MTNASGDRRSSMAMQWKTDGDLQDLRRFSNKRPPRKAACTATRAVVGAKGGLSGPRLLYHLSLWYLLSVLRPFINKYFIDSLGVGANFLSATQLAVTTVASYAQIVFSTAMSKQTRWKKTPLAPLRYFIIVGATRIASVVFGLVSLTYVSVSFNETVKMSAPLFTVILTQVLFERAFDCYVKLSLIPIMLGLALCSAYDLSCTGLGFLVSLSASISECLHNMYSKRLLSDPKYRHTPAELLCHTSVVSIGCQLVALIALTTDSDYACLLDVNNVFVLLVNGLGFHIQLLSAYAVMEYLSDVTFSVFNTTERLLVIWISIPAFKTPVTLLSSLGTVIMTIGVLLYAKASDYNMRSKQSLFSLPAKSQQGALRVRRRSL